MHHAFRTVRYLSKMLALCISFVADASEADSALVWVRIDLVLISGVSNHRLTHHDDTDCMTRSLTCQTLIKYAQSSVCVTITNGAPCFVPNLVFCFLFCSFGFRRRSLFAFLTLLPSCLWTDYLLAFYINPW